MSVNQNVLSCVPSSVSASNAESGTNSILSSWKGLSASWEQESADAAGEAACSYAIKWNNAVIPEIDAKIQKFQAEYDEKQAQYSAVKEQYDAAEQAVRDAQNDMENCKDYEDTGMHGSGMFEGMQSAGGKSAAPRTKVIVDPLGYKEAQKREAQAKAEASRYKGQVDNWKRQMDAAQSQISKAKKEKEILTQKIEKFILNVYDLNLMNESVSFLSGLKNSSIELTRPTQNKLFSRLFFIQNKYRKQFEKFEESLKAAGDEYKNSFELTPESLSYSSVKKVKAKKFKGKLNVSLVSKTATEASLSYKSKSDFIIPKKKLDGAKEKIQALCKNFELKNERNNFSIELNKIYENKATIKETEALISHCDEFASEYTALLDGFYENGASNSKIRILIGKLINWHFARWPKLWYKIVSIFCAVILAAVLVFGILFGIDSVVISQKFKKSFTEWSIQYDETTKEVVSKERRFYLNEGNFCTIRCIFLSEDKIQKEITSHKEFYEKRPERFFEMPEDIEPLLKENLGEILPKGNKTEILLSLRKETGNARSQHWGLRGYGFFEVTTKEDGSIVEMRDISGVGFRQ